MDHQTAGSGLHDIKEGVRLQDTQVEIGNIGFCASPADTVAAPSKRRKAVPKDSLGRMIQQGIVQHQLGISLNLVLLLTMAYTFFPSLRSELELFFKLQYQQPSGAYIQGSRDAGIVLGHVILFTGLRAFFMDYVLRPLARQCGIQKEKAQERFAEQSYMLLYYIVFWSVGLKLFIEHTPPLSAATTSDCIHDLLLSLWTSWPQLQMTAAMKWYYLAQTAFWFQQVLVIHLEERRKDHWQMLTHHFVTIGLLILSYGDRHMRVGNAILVLMDTVDLVFPLAKCLKYVGLQTACDFCFGLFVLSWVFSRHIAYCAILYSLWFHVDKEALAFGTYSTSDGTLLTRSTNGAVFENILQPFVKPNAATVEWSSQIRATFLVLLGGLQVITLVWLVMIVKVVMRVLSGQSAEDTRSDDEDEGEEDMDNASTDVEKELPKFIEVTAEADDLFYSSASRNSPSQANRLSAGPRRKSKGISSSLSLGEHKEILNRIGCLSEEQLARERERRRESTSPQPGSSKRP